MTPRIRYQSYDVANKVLKVSFVVDLIGKKFNADKNGDKILNFLIVLLNKPCTRHMSTPYRKKEKTKMLFPLDITSCRHFLNSAPNIWFFAVFFL